MTGLDLFERLAPRIAPALEAKFAKPNCCILATRVAIEVGSYFGIEVKPVTCQVLVYNRQFRAHVDAGDFDSTDWRADGSYSLGIGYGMPGQDRGRIIDVQGNRWNGHLIAVAADAFGDFAIRQVERPERNILTGAAVFGVYRGASLWSAEHEDSGTVLEYQLTGNNEVYRLSPDWKDRKRSDRIVGSLIRAIRKEKNGCHS